MPPHYDDSATGRRVAVIDNPHIVDLYFGTRVDHFTSYFFDDFLGAE